MEVFIMIGDVPKFDMRRISSSSNTHDSKFSVLLSTQSCESGCWSSISIITEAEVEPVLNVNYVYILIDKFGSEQVEIKYSVQAHPVRAHHLCVHVQLGPVVPHYYFMQ